MFRKLTAAASSLCATTPGTLNATPIWFMPTILLQVLPLSYSLALILYPGNREHHAGCHVLLGKLFELSHRLLSCHGYRTSFQVSGLLQPIRSAKSLALRLHQSQNHRPRASKKQSNLLLLSKKNPLQILVPSLHQAMSNLRLKNQATRQSIVRSQRHLYKKLRDRQLTSLLQLKPRLKNLHRKKLHPVQCVA